MSVARRAVDLSRTLRGQAGLKVRQPLATLWLALPGGTLAERDALLELIRDRDNDRLRAYGQTRDHFPKEWRSAATEMRMSLHLTAAELTELGERIEELLQPYVEGTTGEDRRPGTLPVAFVLFAVPTRMPADEDEGDGR